MDADSDKVHHHNLQISRELIR